jgi:hypothetical protein
MNLIYCGNARSEPRYDEARRGELVVSAPVGFVKVAAIAMRRMNGRRIGSAMKYFGSRHVELSSDLTEVSYGHG